MSTAQSSAVNAAAFEPDTAHGETALPATSTIPGPTTTEATASIPPVDGPAEASATAAAPAEGTAGADEPIYHGALGYKAPGLVNFRFSKRYFWFGEDEPVPIQSLSHYLRGEKPEIAHPTAAWSSQTAKGLLYFAKHADQKATPAGVLNLSEATDIVREGYTEFSFKLHGHKHSFQAESLQEREGWLAALKRTAELAAGKRGEVLASSGYKDSVAHLGKPAALVAATAGTTSRRSTDARPSEGVLRDNASSSSGSSSNGEGKRRKKSKSKSRSVSRGKRASIFGSLLGKKEEHDERKELKRDEKAERKEAKGEPKADAATAATEAPVAGTAAPLDATAIAVHVLNAPAEEIRATTAANVASPAVTEPATESVRTARSTPSNAKPAKRGSIFGNFFEKVRSPASEKKEHEIVPAIPPMDTGTVAPASAPVMDGAAETPSAAALPTTETATPHKEKETFLGKFLNKEKAKTPISEVPPTETPAVAHTGAGEPAQPVAGKSEIPASTLTPYAATTPNAADESKEKRRTSFFGGFGSSMRRKSGTTPEDATNGDHKPSPLPAKLSGLFRNPSKAAKGSKEPKEVVTPPKVGEALETSATTSTVPARLGTDGPVSASTEAGVTRGHHSAGDVVPEPATVGQPPSAPTAVHATA